MYWPEFAQNGKERITIGQLMSFRSGLCFIDQKPDADMIGDLDDLAELLAKQCLAWRPGDYHGYHRFTAGWCASELIRRRDPKHRSLRQYFHEEIAKPLGLEFYIGTPAHIPESRFAVIKDFAPLAMLLHLSTMPWKLVLSFLVPNSLSLKVMMNAKTKKPSEMGFRPIGAWKCRVPTVSGWCAV